MKTTRSLGERDWHAIRGILPVIIFVCAAHDPTWAQEVVGQEQQVLEEIVVTGSRIRRTEFEANSPILVVQAELFEDTSTIGVETILNEMPQFSPAGNEFATAGTQNNARSTTGASTVSLRGLGPN